MEEKIKELENKLEKLRKEFKELSDKYNIAIAFLSTILPEYSNYLYNYK